jgi:hypothetical protein
VPVLELALVLELVLVLELSEQPERGAG